MKKLTLDHFNRFEKELEEAGVKDTVIAPMLLPDYTTEEVSARRLMKGSMENE